MHLNSCHLLRLCRQAKPAARRLAERIHLGVGARWQAFTGRQEPVDAADWSQEVTVNDLQAILRAAEESFPPDGQLYRTLIEAAVTTRRLRLNELVALRWKDVDWLAGTVTVSRAFQGDLLTPPKTGSSRKVRLAPHTRRSLRRYRGSIQGLHPEDLVFQAGTRATPLRPERLRHSLRIVVERAGIRGMTLWSLLYGFKAPWWSRFL